MDYKHEQRERETGKMELHDLKKLESRALDHWHETVERYREDSDFSFGLQWDAGAEERRKRQGRTSIVYNLIGAYVKRVTNAVRQAPPAIQIHAVSGGASKEAAKALSGLIMGIEYASNAQTAYCYALSCACRGGYGAWRVIVDENGDPRIEPIMDPTALMWDPAAQRLDFSDAKWCIYSQERDVSAIREAYGDDAVEGCGEYDLVKVCELWIISNGKIFQYIYTPKAILEVVEYPGKIIPFVIITGERAIIDGKLAYLGITSDAKSPQKEINYLKSEAISRMSMAPKAAYIAKEGADEDYEEEWANAAVEARAVLHYRGDSPPIPVQAPDAPSGFMALAQENIQLMSAITGIYAPSQGENVGNQSGKAIKYEQAQGSLSTFEFLFSLQGGIKRTGEILIDIIPRVWVDDRVRVSLGQDGTQTPVSVGPSIVPNVANLNLGYGEYGVSISAGASYASQREAMIERMTDLIARNPDMIGIIGPWLVRHIDLPGSEQLADALATLQPPAVQQILAQDGDPAQQLAGAMGQVQQLQQQIQQLQAQNAEMQKALETKQVEAQARAVEGDKNRAHDVQMEQLRADLKAVQDRLKYQEQDEAATFDARLKIALAQIQTKNKEQFNG